MKYSKEQIKEIILTDYLDGRLDAKTKLEIDAIIKQDPELSEFLDNVFATAGEPFDKIVHVQPPEHVWQNIKEQIEESRAPSILENLLDRIRLVWARPRLSFAFGSVMTVLIVFLWIGSGQFRGPSSPIAGESNKKLMLLAGGGMVDPEDISNGFGTTIEDYFL